MGSVYHETHKNRIFYLDDFFQVVVVLQQVFPLIQTILSRWLDDSEVVQVGGFFHHEESLCVSALYDLFMCPLTHVHSRLTLPLPTRQCAGCLTNQSEPSYMILDPWWVS